MVDETLKERIAYLDDLFVLEFAKHVRIGNLLSTGGQVALWGSLLFAGLSAIFGLLPDAIHPGVPSWITSKQAVGLAAAVAGGFVVAGREGRFQARAHGHYRRSDGIQALLLRLRTQLSIPPTREEVAQVAADYAELVRFSTRELTGDDKPPGPDGTSHKR
jgi:hypothetical protein